MTDYGFTPQRLLTQLNQIDFQTLIEDGITKTEFNRRLKNQRAGLKLTKQMLRGEQDSIKRRWDGRNPTQAAIERSELSRYEPVDSVLKAIEYYFQGLTPEEAVNYPSFNTDITYDASNDRYVILDAVDADKIEYRGLKQEIKSMVDVMKNAYENRRREVALKKAKYKKIKNTPRWPSLVYACLFTLSGVLSIVLGISTESSERFLLILFGAGMVLFGLFFVFVAYQYMTKDKLKDLAEAEAEEEVALKEYRETKENLKYVVALAKLMKTYQSQDIDSYKVQVNRLIKHFPHPVTYLFLSFLVDDAQTQIQVMEFINKVDEYDSKLAIARYQRLRDRTL